MTQVAQAGKPDLCQFRLATVFSSHRQWITAVATSRQRLQLLVFSSSKLQRLRNDFMHRARRGLACSTLPHTNHTFPLSARHIFHVKASCVTRFESRTMNITCSRMRAVAPLLAASSNAYCTIVAVPQMALASRVYSSKDMNVAHQPP